MIEKIPFIAELAEMADKMASYFEGFATDEYFGETDDKKAIANCSITASIQENGSGDRRLAVITVDIGSKKRIRLCRLPNSGLDTDWSIEECKQ